MVQFVYSDLSGIVIEKDIIFYRKTHLRMLMRSLKTSHFLKGKGL